MTVGKDNNMGGPASQSEVKKVKIGAWLCGCRQKPHMPWRGLRIESFIVTLWAGVCVWVAVPGAEGTRSERGARCSAGCVGFVSPGDSTQLGPEQGVSAPR